MCPSLKIVPHMPLLSPKERQTAEDFLKYFITFLVHRAIIADNMMLNQNMNEVNIQNATKDVLPSLMLFLVTELQAYGCRDDMHYRALCDLLPSDGCSTRAEPQLTAHTVVRVGAEHSLEIHASVDEGRNGQRLRQCPGGPVHRGLKGQLRRIQRELHPSTSAKCKHYTLQFVQEVTADEVRAQGEVELTARSMRAAAEAVEHINLERGYRPGGMAPMAVKLTRHGISEECNDEGNPIE
eukprot:6467368-Amphidinium_carterae.1